MYCFRLMLILMFLYSIFWTGVQCAAQMPAPETCVPERMMLPGGIATCDGSVGFFPAASSGLVALRLCDGKQLWKIDSAQLPVGVIGQSLVALNDDMTVHVFNANGQESFLSEPLKGHDEAGPAFAIHATSVRETANSLVRAETCCSGKSLIVLVVQEWNHPSYGAVPDIGSDSGAFSVDSDTGKVTYLYHSRTDRRGVVTIYGTNKTCPISELPESSRSLASELNQATSVPGLHDRLLHPPEAYRYFPLSTRACKARVLGKRVIYLEEKVESAGELQSPATEGHTPGIPTPINVRKGFVFVPGHPELTLRRFVVVCERDSGKELWRCEIAGMKVAAQKGSERCLE